MNFKRFTGRTPREAMARVRGAFGEEAIILSTSPGDTGVEILAMSADAVAELERHGAAATQQAAPALPRSTPAPSAARLAASEPGQDAEKLAMSTLSFQDYVRERMLRRRLARNDAAAPPAAVKPAVAPPAARAAPTAMPTAPVAATAAAAPARQPAAASARPSALDGALMSELRAMRSVLESRLDALAFGDRLQRSPGRARLAHTLINCGFSPLLVRKLLAGLTEANCSGIGPAAHVLQHNLRTSATDAVLEEQGGIFALIGATGVGKTTSTAKLAAACVARHGADSVGLITLDAYRLGAHEQLRGYGRILGVPVHMAHDRTALLDLLELLASKKMVLIDTVGLAQRASRTAELLDLIEHPRINKLLVINAAGQSETMDEVIGAYRGAACRGVVLSKVDEAVKLGPAIDALIRHRLEVVAVADGQRVPEDWHCLTAPALVGRALRHGVSSSHELDASEVNLILSTPPEVPRLHRLAAI